MQLLFMVEVSGLVDLGGSAAGGGKMLERQDDEKHPSE